MSLKPQSISRSWGVLPSVRQIYETKKIVYMPQNCWCGTVLICWYVVWELRPPYHLLSHTNQWEPFNNQHLGEYKHFFCLMHVPGSFSMFSPFHHYQQLIENQQGSRGPWTLGKHTDYHKTKILGQLRHNHYILSFWWTGPPFANKFWSWSLFYLPILLTRPSDVPDSLLVRDDVQRKPCRPSIWTLYRPVDVTLYDLIYEDELYPRKRASGQKITREFLTRSKRLTLVFIFIFRLVNCSSGRNSPNEKLSVYFVTTL